MIRWWAKQSRGNKVVFVMYLVTSMSAFTITLLVGAKTMRDLVIPFGFQVLFIFGLAVGIALTTVPIFVSLLSKDKSE